MLTYQKYIHVHKTQTFPPMICVCMCAYMYRYFTTLYADVCTNSPPDQYMLCTNGFRDIWLNPLNFNEQTFHKMFIQRLDDQYRQNLLGFIKHHRVFKYYRH